MILVPKERIDHYVREGWWGEQTLGDLFIDTALRQPGQPAVFDPPDLVDITGCAPGQVSWAGMLERVGRQVAFFVASGLKKDDMIVVQLPNSIDLHVIYVSAAICGLIVSPLPVQYRAHEIAHVLAVTGARNAIVAERVGRHACAAHWIGHRHQFGVLDRLWCIESQVRSGGALPAGAEGLQAAVARVRGWGAEELRQHLRDQQVTAHDVVTICWTSGTEAQAKGVPRNHNEWLIVGQSVIDAGELQPGAQMLIPFPFVNMAGLSTSLAAWLMTGGTLHHHHPFKVDVFLAQLREHPIDYSVVAPAVLGMLLKEPQQLEGIDLGRLRRIGSGGAPVAEWLFEQFAERFGIEVVNYFGSNEGAALASAPQDMPDRGQRARYFPRMGVAGFDWSLSNARKVRTRLVDPESGIEISEPGMPGELRFKGPTIFSGYFNAPELSARAFDAEGWYRTGDLFEIAGDRGQFYRFCGRHKDIVIRGSMNISSEEIEGLLLAYPKVREAAVIGYPDPILGERVCAVIAAQPGPVPDLDELVNYLRDQAGVAAYKLPERLIVVEELPRNPLGKILKRTLRERYNKEGT
jgi:acyl-CoA synthetase (AMP-forming)/AMP-acid ligase II